jgi:hypothetical protein
MMNFKLPPIGGDELARIASKSIQKVEDLALNSQNFTMVELPYQIGDKVIRGIVDTTYCADDPLQLALAMPLNSFIKIIASYPEAKNTLNLTDLIVDPLATPNIYHSLENWKTKFKSLPREGYTEYHIFSGATGKGNYSVNDFSYVPLSFYDKGSTGKALRIPPEAPSYQLNLVKSRQPEGGVYKIGFQFGGITPEDGGSYSPPLIRSLEGEAFLAKQLTDLFEAVAKYQ